MKSRHIHIHVLLVSQCHIGCYGVIELVWRFDSAPAGWWDDGKMLSIKFDEELINQHRKVNSHRRKDTHFVASVGLSLQCRTLQVVFNHRRTQINGRRFFHLWARTTRQRCRHCWRNSVMWTFGATAAGMSEWGGRWGVGGRVFQSLDAVPPPHHPTITSSSSSLLSCSVSCLSSQHRNKSFISLPSLICSSNFYFHFYLHTAVSCFVLFFTSQCCIIRLFAIHEN